MTTQLQPAPAEDWQPAELQSIREGLTAAIERLQSEIRAMSTDLASVTAPAMLEILHDELDVASQRAELLQDAVQAENTAAILAQTEHVLARLDAGLYGVCDICSGTIPRARLEAFPRATLCMNCV